MPSKNDISPFAGDDPLFAQGVVRFMGQPLFCVAAESLPKARAAAALAVVEYADLEPLVTAEAAALGAELAVIDTPPHADSMAAAACRAADILLIPCRPRAFDLDAIQTTADLVKASGKPAFVVFTAGPPRAANLYREAAELVRSFGLEVAPVVMSERAAYHHSTGEGKTAVETDPGGKAAEEVAALWAWFSQQVGVQARKRASTKARKVAA